MAKSYVEIHRALSQQIVGEARSAGVYDHPTAKGDGREEILRRVVRERIGDNFDVVKAEIVDSYSNTTPEYDAVIYDKSVAACLHVQNHSRVVRAEAVAMVIEVKSLVTPEAIREAAYKFGIGLVGLRRCYRPTHIHQGLRSGRPEFKEEMRQLDEGIGALEPFVEIPAVVTGVFGYTGPECDTAAKYFETALVDFITVLGGYTLALRGLGRPPEEPGLVLHGDDEDALGAFLNVIEIVLQRFRDARTWVWPWAAKYYKPRRVGDVLIQGHLAKADDGVVIEKLEKD